MAKHTSTAELRKMSAADLQKEIAEKRNTVAKKKINIALRSEKDTAAYNREKKEIARMLTVLNENAGKAEKTPTKTLKAKGKASKVSAPASASTAA